MSAEWHLVTPEFPPHVGGVGDYTDTLARGLAAMGDAVHVWCPWAPSAPPSICRRDGVTVHAVPGRFRPADLRAVGRRLDRFAKPRRLLVQWVPQGYGYHSMNLPFCLWLWRRAVTHGDRIEIVLHEPYLAFGEGSLRQSAVALIHRVMIVLLLRAATHVWTAIPTWEDRWKPYAFGRAVPFTWLPIPSSLPPPTDTATQTVRQRYGSRGRPIIGHFGTFGPGVARLLLDVLPDILASRFGPVVFLLGHDSDVFRERLVKRCPDRIGDVHALPRLASSELAAYLAACDLVIQPYPDGISSRRTTAMASLSLGRPVVTTEGHLTEPLWRESGAVQLSEVGDGQHFIAQVDRLLAQEGERRALGEKGRALYETRFDLHHTIAALRQSPAA